MKQHWRVTQCWLHGASRAADMSAMGREAQNKPEQQLNVPVTSVKKMLIKEVCLGSSSQAMSFNRLQREGKSKVSDHNSAEDAVRQLT